MAPAPTPKNNLPSQSHAPAPKIPGGGTRWGGTPRHPKYPRAGQGRAGGGHTMGLGTKQGKVPQQDPQTHSRCGKGSQWIVWGGVRMFGEVKGGPGESELSGHSGGVGLVQDGGSGSAGACQGEPGGAGCFTGDPGALPSLGPAAAGAEGDDGGGHDKGTKDLTPPVSPGEEPQGRATARCGDTLSPVSPQPVPGSGFPLGTAAGRTRSPGWSDTGRHREGNRGTMGTRSWRA